MKLAPRAKLVVLAALFLAPIVASIAAYTFLRPEPTANYGELLLPPAAVTSHAFVEGRYTMTEMSQFAVLGGITFHNH